MAHFPLFKQPHPCLLLPLVGLAGRTGLTVAVLSIAAVPSSPKQHRIAYGIPYGCMRVQGSSPARTGEPSIQPSLSGCVGAIK
ncbi:MAG TPA: hypothetical protein V6C99_12575, partial [Oculatellaceae cyanobacterium]